MPPDKPPDRTQLQFGYDSTSADLPDAAGLRDERAGNGSSGTVTEPAFQWAAVDVEDTARGCLSCCHAPLTPNDKANWERPRSIQIAQRQHSIGARLSAVIRPAI